MYQNPWRIIRENNGSYLRSSQVTKFKLALKRVRYGDIIMLQEHLHTACAQIKVQGLCTCFNSDAVADIKSQANTMKYRVTAVITEKYSLEIV
jgi:hypothetical protein